MAPTTKACSPSLSWYARSLSIVLATAHLATASPAPPACTGCLLSVGLEVETYTKPVTSSLWVSRWVVPIEFIDNGTTVPATSTVLPTTDPNGLYPHDLTWSNPTLTGVTMTWPTVYAVATALSGGVSTRSVVFDSAPTCAPQVQSLDVPQANYANMVFPLTSYTVGAQPTIPAALVDYLQGIPEVASQFAGEPLAGCRTAVAAATAHPDQIPVMKRLAMRAIPNFTGNNTSTFTPTSSSSSTIITPSNTGSTILSTTSSTSISTELPTVPPVSHTVVSLLTSSTVPTTTTFFTTSTTLPTSIILPPRALHPGEPSSSSKSSSSSSSSTTSTPSATESSSTATTGLYGITITPSYGPNPTGTGGYPGPPITTSGPPTNIPTAGVAQHRPWLGGALVGALGAAIVL